MIEIQVSAKPSNKHYVYAEVSVWADGEFQGSNYFQYKSDYIPTTLPASNHRVREEFEWYVACVVYNNKYRVENVEGNPVRRAMVVYLTSGSKRIYDGLEENQFFDCSTEYGRKLRSFYHHNMELLKYIRLGSRDSCLGRVEKKRQGISPKSVVPRKRAGRTQLNYSLLYQEYLNGATFAELSHKYKEGYTTIQNGIKRHCKEHSLPYTYAERAHYHSLTTPDVIEPTYEDIYYKYMAGTSVRELALLKGVTRDAIYKGIHRYADEHQLTTDRGDYLRDKTERDLEDKLKELLPE